MREPFLVDRLRALADIATLLESPGADFGRWVPSRHTASGAMTMPYYEFGAAGEAFRAAVGRGGWVRPEVDWRTWLSTDEADRLRLDPAALVAATPAQLEHLLTAIIRSDRFSEGQIAGAFESGLLARIARRAAVLLRETELRIDPN